MMRGTQMQMMQMVMNYHPVTMANNDVHDIMRDHDNDEQRATMKLVTKMMQMYR